MVNSVSVPCQRAAASEPSAELTGELEWAGAVHQGAQFGDLLRGAEVDELDVDAAAGGEHDVVGLQVEMRHAAPVQVLQTVQHLPPDDTSGRR